MRLVERTSTTLSLSWDVSPRPRVQLRPIRYELTYRKKVNCLLVCCVFILHLPLYKIKAASFHEFNQQKLEGHMLKLNVWPPS